MTKNNEITSLVNNSTHTCTPSERNAESINFIGNPFKDLAAAGFPPTEVHVSFRHGRNTRGNTITGRFRINGREHTAGGKTYHQFITFAITQLIDHQAWEESLATCNSETK